MTDAMLICQKPTNTDELRSCALFQRKLFEILTAEYGLLWNEILFPCADSRSVTVAQKLNEPSVFGTHAVISASEELLGRAAQSAALLTGCTVPYSIKPLKNKPDALQRALRASAKGFENLLVCGNFGEIVGGCDENFKVRDSARKFLSFAETANDKIGRSLVGILGGKAVFDTSAENAEKIAKIYEAKTGSKMKLYKSGGAAK